LIKPQQFLSGAGKDSANKIGPSGLWMVLIWTRNLLKTKLVN